MIHQAVSDISNLLFSIKPWVVIAISGLVGVAVWIESLDEEATAWSMFGLSVGFLVLGVGLYLCLDTIGALP